MKCPGACVQLDENQKPIGLLDLPEEQMLAHCVLEHPTMPVSMLASLAKVPAQTYHTAQNFELSWSAEDLAKKIDAHTEMGAQLYKRYDEVAGKKATLNKGR